MEKTMSIEERIKRAEEIYNRRSADNKNTKYTYQNYGEKNKNFKLIKKMAFQILLCIIIYTIFYMISSNEYVFSEDFRKNIGTILNTQLDFNKIYNEGKTLFQEWLSTDSAQNVDNVSQNEVKEDSNSKENNENNNLNEIMENQEDITSDNANKISGEQSVENTLSDTISEQNGINIGGAIEESTEVNSEDNVQTEKTQMELDAEDIKSSINFEIPVEGYISSTFGLRNPTTSTVPKNHTGLDIAAPIGTVIRAATDGTIILASSYGDYGNHYKIEIGDVVLVYAHCSKLYLKEGEKVTKGQSIAEVGSTGNSTGPHLHFEIRKDGRYVDPQLILDI